MKMWKWILGVGIALHACGKKNNPPDFLIGPGKWGILDGKMSESQLKEKLGDSLVVRKEVDLGEGESEMGTVLFPGKDAESYVIWTDGSFSQPRRAWTRHPKAPWHTASGLKIGTPLDSVVAKNGKPIRFLGCCWDYEGTISSWNGGNLDSLTQKMVIAFSFGENLPQSLYLRFLGDTQFRSDTTGVDSLGMKIQSLEVIFHPG